MIRSWAVVLLTGWAGIAAVVRLMVASLVGPLSALALGLR